MLVVMTQAGTDKTSALGTCIRLAEREEHSLWLMIHVSSCRLCFQICLWDLTTSVVYMRHTHRWHTRCLAT